jgi:hypothetical protein
MAAQAETLTVQLQHQQHLQILCVSLQQVPSRTDSNAYTELHT